MTAACVVINEKNEASFHSRISLIAIEIFVKKSKRQNAL